jgi:hypothetical protein
MASICGKGVDTTVSMMCRNIEICAIRHYPKALNKQELFVPITGIARNDMLHCMNMLFPTIKRWAKENYNLEEDESSN